MLRRLVTYLEEREPEISEAEKSPKSRPWAVTQSWSIVKAVFMTVKRNEIDEAFRSLLQSYDMGTRDRKIVERAAMTLSRRSKKRATVDKAVADFRRVLHEYREYAGALERVIASGKLHTGGPGSGEFTLINTGGFSSAVMDGVVQRVAEASQLLGAKGLDRILYGDINVTNTIYRSARVYAFYVRTDDTLFVRANIPKATHEDGVNAVIHELAHRLHFKFLRPELGPPNLKLSLSVFLPGSTADKAIFDIYQRLSTQEMSSAVESLPKSGSTFEHKGATYKILGWRRSRGGGVLDLLGPSGPASVSLAGYHQIVGKPSVFVSPYAKKAYQENFAEMVRAYCRNTLPADQVRMLRNVIG